ncbi:MAG: sulfite exporter TauE/SafE family protein [Bacteroidia bacterium]
MVISIALLILLPLVAFFYAAVGHGGASGYLALMALFSFPVADMRSTALLLNIFVSGASFFYFRRNGFFSPKLFVPFAIGSVPASFFGGMVGLDPTIYKQVLGVFLIIAVLRILGVFGTPEDSRQKEVVQWLAVLIGVSIGLFSGMIGIGGGIILSPVILLLGWGGVKETAAVSALFILVNSISGMAGIVYTGSFPSLTSWILVGFAVIGGALGGYFGSVKISGDRIKYVLGVVLILASFKLIWM